MAIEMIQEATIEMVDEEIINVQLYKNNSYLKLPYTTRIYNKTEKESIETVICPNIEMSIIKFNKWLNFYGHLKEAKSRLMNINEKYIEVIKEKLLFDNTYIQLLTNTIDQHLPFATGQFDKKQRELY